MGNLRDQPFAARSHPPIKERPFLGGYGALRHRPQVPAGEPDRRAAIWQVCGPDPHTLLYEAATGRLVHIDTDLRLLPWNPGEAIVGERQAIVALIDLDTFEYVWRLPHAGAASADGRWLALPGEPPATEVTSSGDCA